MLHADGARCRFHNAQVLSPVPDGERCSLCALALAAGLDGKLSAARRDARAGGDDLDTSVAGPPSRGLRAGTRCPRPARSFDRITFGAAITGTALLPGDADPVAGRAWLRTLIDERVRPMEWFGNERRGAMAAAWLRTGRLFNARYGFQGGPLRSCQRSIGTRCPKRLAQRPAGVRLLRGAGRLCGTPHIRRVRRELIARRTQAGLAAARARGRMGAGGRARWTGRRWPWPWRRWQRNRGAICAGPQGQRDRGGQAPRPDHHHALRLRQR